MALTSCTRVAHIGDSLTYPTQTELTAAYASVGAEAVIDAGGGRAILQKLAGDPRNGRDAAAAIRESGFTGCWVIALGTNDTANVAAGARYSRAEAIDAMMRAIDPSGSTPVVWVNTATKRRSGFYSNENMILWNEALERAKRRWPKLIVFDWAAIVSAGVAPFRDGVHHRAGGYAVRNEAIAKALARFFPVESPSF